MKGMDKNGEAFDIARGLFPKLSNGKLKEVVLVGPQIRKMMECNTFENALTPIERTVWMAVRDVCENFLGNNRADNYMDLMKHMLHSY